MSRKNPQKVNHRRSKQTLCYLLHKLLVYVCMYYVHYSYTICIVVL